MSWSWEEHLTAERRGGESCVSNGANTSPKEAAVWKSSRDATTHVVDAIRDVNAAEGDSWNVSIRESGKYPQIGHALPVGAPRCPAEQCEEDEGDVCDRLERVSRRPQSNSCTL